jgi:hypothetical protein
MAELYNYYYTQRFINSTTGAPESRLQSNEPHKVLDYKITLDTIPDQYYRTSVVCSTVPSMYEIPLQAMITASNQYKVDYYSGSGFIYFHSSMEGKAVTVTYRGKGWIIVDISRMGTLVEGQTVPQTIKEMIDDFSEAEAQRVLNEEQRQEDEDIRKGNEIIRTANDATRQAVINAFKVNEPYNNTHSYMPLNKVSYMGNFYQNQIACSGIAPDPLGSSTNWLLIAQRGNDGLASFRETTITVSSNGTTHIVHGLDFDPLHDALKVTGEYGQKLFKTEQYTLNADNLSIDLVGWTADAGFKFNFELLKGMNDATLQELVDEAVIAKTELQAVLDDAEELIELGNTVAGHTTQIASINDEIGDINTAIENIESDVTSISGGLTSHLNDTISHAETSTRTLYVDITNGNNSNSGTQAAPFQTLTYALTKIKKNLYSDVKIRILQGDYTSEGVVNINNFKSAYLIITAFDGTNDVSTLSDSYNFFKFRVDSCDKIQIQGLKINWNQANDYGIFTTNTRFGYYIGIKNTDTTALNNGFGVTVNSEVYLDGCLCSGKDTVVSCNFGSRVVSANWDSGSTGNRVGLWAHGGSIIFKDGNQPVGTVYNDNVDHGGKIVEESGQNRTSQTFFTANATTTGYIDIPINLPISPSWIKIDSILTGSKEMSWGQWSKNKGTPSQSCVFRNNADTVGGSYDMAQLNDGGGNVVQYQVNLAYPSVIRLNITKTGSPTGTIYLNVLCGC